MSSYSDQEIELLIACPKRMLNPPQKCMKRDGAHSRLDFDLTATGDIPGEFRVFFRKHADFQENFSLGLVYRPMDGRAEIILLRCNGAHGPYNGTIGAPDHPHWDFHIHKATEESITNNRRAEKEAVATTAYASFEQAQFYFLTTIQLMREDRETYFPELDQPMLFE